MEPTIFKPRLKFKPPLKFFKFGHWCPDKARFPSNCTRIIDIRMIYAMHAEYIEMIQLCIICVYSKLVGLNVISINSYNWRLAYKVLRDSLRKSWFNLNPIHPPHTKKDLSKYVFICIFI